MADPTPGPWHVIGFEDLPDVDDLMIVAFDVAAPGEAPPELYICNIGSDGGRYDVIRDLRAALAKAEAERDEAWRWLESLTPGGGEEFLKRMGWFHIGDKYIDGLAVAEQQGMILNTPVPKVRAFKKNQKLADVAQPLPVRGKRC